MNDHHYYYSSSSLEADRHQPNSVCSDRVSAKTRDRSHCRSSGVCGNKCQNDVLQSFSEGLEPPTLNLRTSLDSDGQSMISIMSQESPLQNGRSTWGCKHDSSADMSPWDNGISCCPASAASPVGHVISVKWEGLTRKIGIDGSADAVKDAIRAAFGLRSKLSFWVEDEDGVVRSFDRTMPQTIYTLHVDPGVTIKLYHLDECNKQIINSEDVTLYDEDDIQELLLHHGWQSL